jgi:thiol-disulfide isomerase/thioredoxin
MGLYRFLVLLNLCPIVLLASVFATALKVPRMSILNKYHANVENFDSSLDSFKGKALYVCFMSEWCPDCEAVPGIESALESVASERSEEVSLLLVKVGPKEYWKSKEHPLRSHTLQIKGIPTLVHISASGSVSKLEVGLYDGSAMRDGGLDLVSRMVKDFTAQTS